MNYVKHIPHFLKENNISQRLIDKLLPTIDKPYFIPNTNNKIYFSNEYIEIKDFAVPIEESLELLSSDIGKRLIEENPEINECLKKHLSSYSVEVEPDKNQNIISPRALDIPTEISG